MPLATVPDQGCSYLAALKEFVIRRPRPLTHHGRCNVVQGAPHQGGSAPTVPHAASCHNKKRGARYGAGALSQNDRNGDEGDAAHDDDDGGGGGDGRNGADMVLATALDVM